LIVHHSSQLQASHRSAYATGPGRSGGFDVRVVGVVVNLSCLVLGNALTSKFGRCFHILTVPGESDQLDRLIHARRPRMTATSSPRPSTGRSEEPRDGAAFPHRHARFYSEPGVGWGIRGQAGSGDAITPKAQAWIAEFSQALRLDVNGAMSPCRTSAMADWETACWGSNFDRLRKINARYGARVTYVNAEALASSAGSDAGRGSNPGSSG
jgi:hypothetical protein